jgi:hypothetical protein
MITKLDEYIEPPKEVKEAKGDVRDANRYNFGALINKDEESEEEEEKNENEKEKKEEEVKVEEEETKKKKKKKGKQNKKEEDDYDLDEVLAEFGVDVKNVEEEKKENKPKKEKKVKEEKKDDEDKKEEKNEEKKEGEEEEEDNSMSSEISVSLGLNGFKSLSYKFAKKVKLLAVSVPIPPFILIFPPFPMLQMRIVPALSFALGFEIGSVINVFDKELSVFFDISASAEVSVNLEMGAYFPQFPTVVEMSLLVGLKGILGSGTVGMRIELFLTKLTIKINLSMEFKALEFGFFILLTIKIDLKFVKLNIQLYIINKSLFDGFGYSKTTEIVYELFNFASLSVKQTKKITNGAKI